MGQGHALPACGRRAVSRLVWLDDGFVDPGDAALSIDDPGVRHGEGLFETMRAENRTIPWLDRHLGRLERSISALGLVPMPDLTAVRSAATHVALALPAGLARIRVTVTPRPTLLVEGEAIAPEAAASVTAASIRGAWHPNRTIAEHKTLSFLGWRDSQRRAAALGADTALLLDENGRLGEASTANVFCVIGGELVTPPIRGILPGITRGVVMELTATREEVLDESTWRAADEIFLTSGVRGVVGVAACDDAVIGIGSARVTAEVAALVAESFRHPRTPSRN